MTGLIVHEWISKAGGSEKVLDAMCDAFADADVLCLWNEDPTRVGDPRLLESWLASTPLRRRKVLALPLMPFVWRHLPHGDKYEWILSSSHLFAHQARFTKNPDAPKFVYVHSPARYIWNPELDDRGSAMVARLSSRHFRTLDRHFAQDDSKIAANSLYIRDRVQAAWHRESEVIYPPVDVAGIQVVDDWTDHLTAREVELVESLPPTFVLGASRFVPYKRMDTVIRVGEETDVPVVLAGHGPDEGRLREAAANSTVPVVFVSSPSDALLYVLFRRALVYVFPAVEDFGIMPVEAMAAGARVVVNNVGGASESVVHGVTGYHTDTFVGEGIRRAVSVAASLKQEESKVRARDFSAEKFESSLLHWMADVIPHPVGALSE